jgi:DNA-binding CsgD family transcriptional regulator/tetratricopeptide (TPR) repeat protein
MVVTAQEQLLQLSNESKAILEAAALLDQPFPLILLVDLGFSADSFDLLFDNGIFRESLSNRAEFTNAELRARLLDQMSWSKKRRFCEQVGELLSKRRDSLEQAADFFCRAHRYDGARACLMQAAEEACHSGQYIKAFSLWKRVLEIWPPDENAEQRNHALKEMARCARHAREFGAARLAWEEILATCRAIGLAEGEIEAHNQVAEFSQLIRDYPTAICSLRKAAELRQQTGSAHQAARQWLTLASFLAWRLRLRDALVALAHGRDSAEKAEDIASLSEICALEGNVLAMMGKHNEAQARVDHSLEMALSHSLPMQAATAYRLLGDLREFKADYDGAREAHLRAISFCRKKGTASEEHLCFGCLGYALFRTGQWRKAIENARKVLLNQDVLPLARAAVAVVPAMISALRGERRHADARLAEALLQLRANNLAPLEFSVLWVRGVMADFEGNHSVAAEQYAELFSLWHETEDRMLAVPGVVSAAGFYRDRGDDANLAACCEVLNVIAQENQNEESRAASRAVLAETAWHHGDRTSAIALMREALERYDRVGTTLEMAFLRRRLAIMLVTLDEPREAEERRREASELARRLGLRPFLDSLEHDKITSGFSLSHTASGPGTAIGLTPRQHSILGLIAKGLTNKEVASHLNLSTRTVEMHVALALERLNCRTRSEAVSRAISLGLLAHKTSSAS